MITGTERILLERYCPDSPLLLEPLQAPVGVDITKAAYTLTLADKIALMKAQGAPEFVISILECQLKINQEKGSK